MGAKHQITNMPCIKFGDNNYRYTQDFSFLRGVPADVLFYPIEELNCFVTFIGNKHGISRNNKYGLSGEYGNGAIFVYRDELPKEILEWCKSNFLKEQKPDPSPEKETQF